SYSREQFRRMEKAWADLVVRVFTPNGNEIAVSDCVYNAAPEVTIDVTVGGAYRGPSEVEILLAAITPLLDSVAIGDLREDDKYQDITFLSRESEEPSERITFLRTAHRLMRRTNMAAEIFYGLFRQGLPTELSALLMQSPEVVRRALIKSCDENIIPLRFKDESKNLLARFKELIVQEALEPPADDSKGRASLKELLSVSLQEPKLREDFVRAYVHHKGPIQGFWKALRTRPDFQGRVDELQFTLQLSAFAANHLPLVLELTRMRKQNEIGELKDLTRFDEKSWLDIISRGAGNGPIGAPPDIPGKDDDEKRRIYAKAITHMVEDAFPTAFVTQRLRADSVLGQSDLVKFFNANPNYKIKSGRLGAYLRENPGAFDGIQDVAAAKKRINAFQRVYKLAPRYEHAAALFKDGIDSAMRIARMDRQVLHKKYAPVMSVADVARLHEGALQTHAIAQNILLEYGVESVRLSTRATPDEAVLEVNGMPEWSTLFGSVELCGCEHCRSIYSPAAYFVDILDFLSDRSSTVAGKSVKDILFMRRSDLGEIELTCENTNTPLPYVDLVNEALEDAIAPPREFSGITLRAELESDLNKRTVSDALRTAFTPPLSEHAIITVASSGKPWPLQEPSWTIEEPGFTYTLRKEGSDIKVVTRSRQTKGSAAERAAEPQYFNEDAYRALAGRAFHPWSLPFVFPWEETRAYLEHLRTPRHLIMETFHRADRLGVLGDAGIAFDYLGFSREEANLVTGAFSREPHAVQPERWSVWGIETEWLTAASAIADPSDSTRRIAAGPWLSVLNGRVDVFLQQSGLSYKEMLNLLDTYYVNPLNREGVRSIRIVSHLDAPADTCETAKLRLVDPGYGPGLNAANAARIARFVRLWRKLGWSMRDLDRAFTAFAPGDTPEDLDVFLVHLSIVQRLRAQLNVPLLRLLSWWSNIDHIRTSHVQAVYTDHDVSGQPRGGSLYEQLFRNKTVLNPPDPAFLEYAERLEERGDDPAIPPEKLSTHVAAIVAPLQIGAADFAQLLHNENIIPTAPEPTEADPDRRAPDDRLTIGNLSRLHRHAGLARALRVS
ncbi:MAG TPA: hypothetical protein VM532_10340, partial [Burkholderiales bacterium]|nr:hypothetical protein [Burkholderiales bacterium]